MRADIVRNITGDLDFNEEFSKAFDCMENTSSNLFMTGKAGTGKSTLLEYFRDHTDKNIAVLAATGVAAINVRGQTIHSFFRFRPDITPDGVSGIRMRKAQRKIYKNLDAIVIDEISMVRADLLDCIDQFLRLHGKSPDEPFGGVQMIFFGDLFQLPPVVTRQEAGVFTDYYQSPYFFHAKSFDSLNMLCLELSVIYRQKDESFIRLLGAIRNDTVSERDLLDLNERYQPHFVPDEKDFYVYLTTTNALAERVNRFELNRIDQPTYTFHGEVSGKFEERNLPTLEDLKLKTGAQIMLLNNDPSGRWINGSIGRVDGFDEENKSITVQLKDGNRAEVTPFSWDMYRFFFNEETEKLESESVGTYRQFPLKLSWAITIHKGQGMSFSKVILDIGTGTFSHGQLYVALSRCSDFDGLILKRPIRREHILLDRRIEGFLKTQFGEGNEKILDTY